MICTYSFKVPKVASTALVEAMLEVVGREDLIETSGRSRQHTALRKLMPPQQHGETMPNTVNFMVVRHPLQRVLSAYRFVIQLA